MNRSLLVLCFVFSISAVLASGNTVHQAITNAATAETGFFNSIFDEEDGMLDLSVWLAKSSGFLPLPLIITEPAVGFGAGAALIFFHENVENREALMEQAVLKDELAELPPPSASGVLGVATANGSWGAGGFHMGNWKNDSLRYLGALAYMSVNYDFYGTGEQNPDDKIPVNVEGAFFIQQLKYRIPKSDIFVGANYLLISSVATADLGLGDLLPPPAEDGERIQSGGASAILEYDNRDNIFTPNQGPNFALTWTHYASWLGSDTQFDRFESNNRYYHSIKKNLVLGIRLDGDFSSGDVPFYMLPFVRIRGIPMMRYQGDHALVAEAEVRWDINQRWSLVGFGGAGWTANGSVSDFGNSDTYPAGGVGFRYLLASIFQLRAGADIAVSEEDTAFYLTTGSAWGRF